MEKAFDRASIRRTLQHGVRKGYWTLEDLDQPAPGWASNLLVDRNTFPNGYIGIAHENLLRDYHPELPEAAPSPRDLAMPNKAALPAPKKATISDDPF
jgi:hypothetical protein